MEGGELSILSCHGNCATQGTLLHVRGLWRDVSDLTWLSWKVRWPSDEASSLNAEGSNHIGVALCS